MNDAPPRQLVIAGMHRSGTSLLASAMERAGVFIGERLLGASESNVKGHFEDLDLLQWHEAVFAENGRTLFDAHERGPLAISDARRVEAAQLIEARRHRPLWGWKDPRTCLFLEFWRSMLPDPRFLFVVRRPDEVLASLDRRRHDELTRRWPGLWTLKRLGLDATFRRRRAGRWWLASNRAILAFASAHPDRCLVLELSTLRSRLPAAIERMRSSWRLPLADVDLDAVLDEGLLQTAGPEHGRPPAPGGEIGRTFAALRGLAEAAGH